jgi:hypothetical protein
VQVNERYLPQLSSILSFPQSVGIVGGRPGASLYFVGVQGGAVLYLDPHEVQQVGCGQDRCMGSGSLTMVANSVKQLTTALFSMGETAHIFSVSGMKP